MSGEESGRNEDKFMLAVFAFVGVGPGMGCNYLVFSNIHSSVEKGQIMSFVYVLVCALVSMDRSGKIA